MIASATLFGLDTDIAVSVTDPNCLDRAVRHTRSLARRLDETINRGFANAEIIALDLADGEPVMVSSLLDQVIIEALFYDDLTDGATQAVLGPATGSPVPPWHRVNIGGAATTVPAGLRLDLMATGRAFLADHAAEVLARELGCGVLIRVGAVAATAGEAPSGGPGTDEPWTVDIDGVRIPLCAGQATARVGDRRGAAGQMTIVAGSAAMAHAAGLYVLRAPADPSPWLRDHAAAIISDEDGNAHARPYGGLPVAAA
jgi:thiamine biosynthesis lipoprotein ApbE